MKKHGNPTCFIAWTAITAGIIILLSRILPSGFWWFMLGVSLIAGGLCLKRLR